MDLRFRPCLRQQITEARHCQTFQIWESQNEEEFSIIHLGNLIFPDTNLQKVLKQKMFDIHRWIKSSAIHNFMDAKIQIRSLVKPEVCQLYLSNYRDSQYIFLIRFGFFLDFDYNKTLQNVNKNIILISSIQIIYKLR